MKSAIIFHHNDADGRCAAAVMKAWFDECGEHQPFFIELDYKDRVEPFLPTCGGNFVAVLDLSFKPDIMAEARRRAEPGGVIWCDHHVTAKDYGYDDLPGVRDFTEKGLSGAECTWKFCFPDKPMPEGLVLLGDYDAWRLKHVPRTHWFYEGLKLQQTEPYATDSIWHDLLFAYGGLRDKVLSRVIAEGKTALQYRDNYCKRMAVHYGYETEIHGHAAYALNVYSMGSQGFPEPVRELYPVLIAYIYDGRRFTVSLYSTRVDVSQIAKAEGGGGHKEAAGFVCEKLPFERCDGGWVEARRPQRGGAYGS